MIFSLSLSLRKILYPGFEGYNLNKTILLPLLVSIVVLNVCFAAESSNEYTAVKIDHDITIDGNLRDFEKTQPIVMDDSSKIQSFENQWPDSNDLSSVFYINYNNHSLYFGFRVYDDEKNTHYFSSFDSYNYDGVELFISAGNAYKKKHYLYDKHFGEHEAGLKDKKRREILEAKSKMMKHYKNRSFFLGGGYTNENFYTNGDFQFFFPAPKNEYSQSDIISVNKEGHFFDEVAQRNLGLLRTFAKRTSDGYIIEAQLSFSYFKTNTTGYPKRRKTIYWYIESPDGPRILPFDGDPFVPTVSIYSDELRRVVDVVAAQAINSNTVFLSNMINPMDMGFNVGLADKEGEHVEKMLLNHSITPWQDGKDHEKIHYQRPPTYMKIEDADGREYFARNHPRTNRIIDFRAVTYNDLNERVGVYDVDWEYSPGMGEIFTESSTNLRLKYTPTTDGYIKAIGDEFTNKIRLLVYKTIIPAPPTGWVHFNYIKKAYTSCLPGDAPVKHTFIDSPNDLSSAAKDILNGRYEDFIDVIFAIDCSADMEMERRHFIKNIYNIIEQMSGAYLSEYSRLQLGYIFYNTPEGTPRVYQEPTDYKGFLRSIISSFDNKDNFSDKIVSPETNAERLCNLLRESSEGRPEREKHKRLVMVFERSAPKDGFTKYINDRQRFADTLKYHNTDLSFIILPKEKYAKFYPADKNGRQIPERINADKTRNLHLSIKSFYADGRDYEYLPVKFESSSGIGGFATTNSDSALFVLAAETSGKIRISTEFGDSYEIFVNKKIDKIAVPPKGYTFTGETYDAFERIARLTKSPVTYFKDLNNLPDKIDEYADLKRGEKVDLQLVIDTTGGMRDEVNLLKQSAYRLAHALYESEADLRTGLVLYKDDSPNTPYISTNLGFSDSPDGFVQQLVSMRFGGGGRTIEEALYQGLDTAANAQTREGAKRRVLLIADAGPREDLELSAWDIRRTYREKFIELSIIVIPTAK